jgi:KipI family sensor histidine kinase inhibitor
VTEWVALGDRAIRFARPPGSSPRALVRAIRAWPDVIDVVVAPADVAVYFTGVPHVEDSRVRALASLDSDPTPVRDVELRVRYDGADLAEVAGIAGRTIDEVIEAHRSASYVVEAMGFAPGFGYLGGLPAMLHVARRATPRTRVPAGALAIADAYTAVYPFDSPGGWNLIGHVVGVTMFGPEGALLQLGDRVRFVA